MYMYMYSIFNFVGQAINFQYLFVQEEAFFTLVREIWTDVSSIACFMNTSINF